MRWYIIWLVRTVLRIVGSTMATIRDNFEYYLSHQKELVAKYAGKYIVIHECEVVGDFDDELKAIEESSKKYELGSFIVQKCEPGNQEYTQTFHSRFVFV